MINDGFAELCAKESNHFPGWVAQICLDASDAGVAEAERAINNLSTSASGVLVTRLDQLNQAIKTKGVEAELRWSVDRHALITANYTYIDVVNAAALNAGLTGAGYFNYFGIGDLVNVTNPALFLGGSQPPRVFRFSAGAKRAPKLKDGKATTSARA